MTNTEAQKVAEKIADYFGLGAWNSKTIAAIISRHISESDLYRAGVAACVEKVKAARGEWNSLIANDEDRWHKGGHCAAEELVTVLESLANSASPAAQQEVNSGEEQK